MSKLSKQDELILLLSLSKMWSEQSGYLHNELQRSDKEAFNRALNGIDSFINHFDKKVGKEYKSVYEAELEGITICLNDGMTGLRKDLLDKQLKG
jgi:hypothetical protein